MNTKKTHIPFLGLDVSVPDTDAPDGTLRVQENMCWVGPDDAPRLTPVESADPRTVHSENIVALGTQVRQTGPGALERLVLVTEKDVRLINADTHVPATPFAYEWPTAEPGRRATMTQVGDKLYIATTVDGAPNTFIEVVNDDGHEFGFAHVPSVNISSSGGAAGNDNDHVFRFAWLTDTGVVGPATEPIVFTADVDDNEFVFTITNELGLPSAELLERYTGVAVLVQPAALVGAGGELAPGAEFSAFKNPTYHIGTIAGTDVGTSFTYEGTPLDWLTEDVYEEGILTHHKLQPGSVASYNRRLLLGDVSYDFVKPDIRRIIEWDPSFVTSLPTFFLYLRVKIDTQNGTFYRYSDALPFDGDHDNSVTLRSDADQHALISYPDRRAVEWQLFAQSAISQFPDPPDEASTINLVGASTDFTKALGNYVYTSADGPWDLTQDSGTVTDVGDDFFGPKSISETAHQGLSAFTRDETATNSSIGPLSATARVEVSVRTAVTIVADGGSGRSEVTVQVLDAASAVLDEASHDVELVGLSEFALDKTDDVTLVLENVTGGETIRIETDIEGSLQSPIDGNDLVYCEATATTVLVIEGEPNSETVTAQEIQETNQEVARDPNRVFYSDTNQPLAVRAENTIYVGNGPQDAVLDLIPVAREVSQGQFGAFPILVACRESFFALEVGVTTFLTRVVPIDTQRGLVGRRAWTYYEGGIVGATKDGIYFFSPRPGSQPLSAPLHAPDFSDDILTELGTDTILERFLSSGRRSRDEIWVSVGDKIYCLSMRHGRWFVMTRARDALLSANIEDDTQRRMYGAEGGQLFEEAADTTSLVPFKLQTAPLDFGDAYIRKRLRAAGLRGRPRPQTVDIHVLVRQEEGDDIEVAAGFLERTFTHDFIKTPHGHGYEFYLTLEGEGVPGETLEALAMEYTYRQPHRVHA